MSSVSLNPLSGKSSHEWGARVLGEMSADVAKVKSKRGNRTTKQGGRKHAEDEARFTFVAGAQGIHPSGRSPGKGLYGLCH